MLERPGNRPDTNPHQPAAGQAARTPGCSGFVLSGRIQPGRVFDLTLPLDQVAEGYRAMDERRAVKALLEP